MISFWWIVAAFIGGGVLGMLVIALMHTAANMPKQATEIADLDVTSY
jgi:hypothetical protein